MKHTHIPKFFIGLTVLFAALLVLGDHQTAIGQTSNPPTQKYLSGFAWSSNIGWISLQGSSYGVNLSPAGELSGFAWSSNIGWISFNKADLSSCPSGACTATIDLNSRKVDGWARVCSGTLSKDCKGAARTDGWDGWIHLSGTNHPSPYAAGNGGVTYVPSTTKLSGFAWGSEVVGWIDFSGVSIVSNPPVIVETDETDETKAPVIASFKMIPNTVKKGQSCQMNWEVENADNCTITGPGYLEDDASLPTGSDYTLPITAASRYTMTCSNAAGTVSKEAICRVNVDVLED